MANNKINSHVVYFKFMPPTNTRPARMKLWSYEVNNYENRFKPKSMILKFNFDENAQTYLFKTFKKAGLKLVGFNDRHTHHSIYMFKWDIDKLKTFFGVKTDA